MKHYIFDEYVISAIPNAFNNNFSYWVSKTGYSIAYYLFSDDTNDAILAQLENVSTYTEYFEQRNQ